MLNVTRNLILRFCYSKMVDKSRARTLQIKTIFMTKLKFLRSLGKKKTLLTRVDSFLQHNVSQLAEKYIEYGKK
jgi:hypothetical protein